MAQTIQILRTNSNTPPAALLPGVLSAELGPQTKLWIGAPGGNRLLLSSDPVDNGAAAGAYLKLTGGTLTGPLQLAADPAVNLGAATKQYVDAVATAGAAADTAIRNTYLPLAGGTLTGPLQLAADPAINLGAATKQYVDAVATAGAAADTAIRNTYLPLAGGTLTGTLVLNGDPTANLGAATKQYVDTTTVKINSPVFTGDPQAPTAAPGDNDNSLATTAFVHSAVAPALNDVGRNLIHNSLFNIAQRGAGTFTSFGSYTADRWVMDGSLDTVSFSLGAFSDTARSQIGDEAATQFLENDFTGNAGAAAQSYVQQKIEGVRRLAGKTVTVSFWAVSSGTLKLGVNIVQIFGTGGSPSPFVQVLGAGNSFTTSGTWARFTTTIAIPSIAGKTLGTNGDDYTILRFYYSSGATNNATAGNIGVQSGTTNIWGVQLEIGSVATPLEKPDPQQDLAKCQRFYQAGTLALWGTGAIGNPFGYAQALNVLMRAAPTVGIGTPVTANVGTFSTLPYPTAIEVYGIPPATGFSGFRINFTASADL